MLNTVKAEEYYISKVDNFRDRYLIEYPEQLNSGLLVIYLHGGLSDAEQGFCTDYEWCFHNLCREVLDREGVYVSPQYRGDSWMNAAAEVDMVMLIKSLRERFGIKQVIITGGSMGGTAALILASHHPELFDGVVAMCPATDMRKLYLDLSTREELIYRHIAKSIVEAYGGTPDKIPDEYDFRSSIKLADRLDMPVVIRHGDADEIIPVAHARELVDALQGRKVVYDEISGGDHDSPTVNTPWAKYLNFILQNR